MEVAIIVQEAAIIALLVMEIAIHVLAVTLVGDAETVMNIATHVQLAYGVMVVL